MKSKILSLQEYLSAIERYAALRLGKSRNSQELDELESEIAKYLLTTDADRVPASKK
ncbi:MAG: hypothetical protein Q7N95_12930 [Alphaproteobacteria bacterium]|nr:hypothetical protein [Alphaproteobacteria bacterium]